MANPRVRRIADRIKVVVAEMLERRIKDPRLGFVTVTDVRVSGDTQQATVFYTVLGQPGKDDQTDLQGSAAALESAKGLIRSEVGKQLGMRHVPTLEFVARRPARRPHATSTTCSTGCGSPTPRRRSRAPVRRTPASPTRTRSEPTTSSTSSTLDTADDLDGE